MRKSLVVAVLLAPLAALAQPQHVRLSWCGGQAGTSMCITWNDPGGGGNQVQYGLSQTLTESVTATAISAPDPLGVVYEAQLVNLKPNTTYNYRVGGGGNPWSDSFTFKTGPVEGDECVPFRFVALGDNRSQDESGADLKWNGILGEAIDREPAFVLNTGDLVEGGDQPAQWKDYLEKTDPVQAYFPMFPSLGNHDDDKIEGEGALYNILHQLPRNPVSNTEDYYFFTYGDAIFVSITTQNFNDDAFAAQAQWLDDVLTDNPRRWKFVYFHHPIYTGYADVFGLEIGHPPNEKGQNAALVPIFDKHHVDMVFNGHNHWYQRFEPMKGGGGSDQGTPVSSPGDGTIYMITGGAGAFTFDIDLGDLEIDPLELVCSTATGTLVCDGRHHYVVVDIDKNELTVEVWATAAQNFDNDPANIVMIDSLSITKDDPLECVSPPDPVEPGPETSEMPEVAEPMDFPPDVSEPSDDVMEPSPEVIEPDAGEGTTGSDGTDSGDATDGTDGSTSTDGTTGTTGTTGTDGTSGSTGTTGTDGTTGATGVTGLDFGTGSTAQSTDDSSDGGCTAAPTGAGHSTLVLWLMSFAALILWRRRRTT